MRGYFKVLVVLPVIHIENTEQLTRGAYSQFFLTQSAVDILKKRVYLQEKQIKYSCYFNIVNR